MDGVQLPQGYSHFKEAVYCRLDKILAHQKFVLLVKRAGLFVIKLAMISVIKIWCHANFSLRIMHQQEFLYIQALSSETFTKTLLTLSY